MTTSKQALSRFSPLVEHESSLKERLTTMCSSIQGRYLDAKQILAARDRIAEDVLKAYLMSPNHVASGHSQRELAESAYCQADEMLKAKYSTLGIVDAPDSK